MKAPRSALASERNSFQFSKILRRGRSLCLELSHHPNNARGPAADVSGASSIDGKAVGRNAGVGDASAETVVAVDTIGAGTGERVLVVFGRAARHAIGRGQDVGFQTAIVGIIDAMELAGGERVEQVAEAGGQR